MKAVETLNPVGKVATAAAFDQAAARYDRQWTDAVAGTLQREQVWRYIDPLFRAGDRVLDLGCGTGADAVHLAGRGVVVHGTDASGAMVSWTKKRVASAGLGKRVTTQVLAIEELDQLSGSDPFDGVLSNFGAMNCVADLRAVAKNLARLVRPGGNVALCVLGRFCLWETLWYLAGADFDRAFRRWRNRGRATLGSGPSFPVYYPSVREIRNAFEPRFRLKSVRGIGVCVPPSYAEGFVASFPRVARGLAGLDRYVGSWAGLRGLADHRLLVFKRPRVSLPRREGLVWESG